MDDMQRWAEAQRRADLVDDPTKRRTDRRALLAILLAGLAAGAIGAVVRVLLSSGEAAPAGRTDAGAPPSALYWIGVTITVAGLALTVVVLVRALTTGRLVIVTSRVDAPLSGRQRRRVGRILRGRERANEAELPVVRAIAGQRVQTFRALVPAYGCLGLFIVGTVLAFADVDVRLPLLFGGLGAFAVIVLALDTTVQVRPARHYLQLHP